MHRTCLAFGAWPGPPVPQAAAGVRGVRLRRERLSWATPARPSVLALCPQDLPQKGHPTGTASKTRALPWDGSGRSVLHVA